MLQSPQIHHAQPQLKKEITETDNGTCNHIILNDVIEETDNDGKTSSNYCMRKEANRLKSFVNWPVDFLKPEQLAKAGFYYTQHDDYVRCPFCNVEVGQWEEGDDPLADHFRWSGSCSFLTNAPCGNVTLEENPNPAVMPQGYDTCGKYGIEIRPNSFAGTAGSAGGSQDINLRKLGIQTNIGPAYPNYAHLEKRLESFADWPSSIKQTPKQLAEAGFFYNQKGDQTICFYCGGGLKSWVESDDPWEQHVRWYSKCGFARLQKGNEYISEVCNRLPAIISSEDACALHTTETNDLNNREQQRSSCSSSLDLQSALTTLNIVEKKSSTSTSEENPQKTHVKQLNCEANKNATATTSTLCKICFSKEVGVVFLPCGHIVACVDCAPALRTCAVCRKPLEAIVRAFLS